MKLATAGSFVQGDPRVPEIGRLGAQGAADGHARRRYRKYAELFPGVSREAIKRIREDAYQAGDRNGYRRGLRDAQKKYRSGIEP